MRQWSMVSSVLSVVTYVLFVFTANKYHILATCSY